MLLSQLTEYFTLDCKSRSLSQATLTTYNTVLTQLCDFLEDPQVNTITTNDLRRYIVHTQERGLYGAGNHPFKTADPDTSVSVWTIHKHTRVIKTLFAFAVRENILTEDPSAKLKKPKLPTGYIKPFTDEQIQIILDEAKKTSYRNYCIVLTFLDSGLRRGELVRLTVNDVNLITGIVTVLNSKFGKSRQVKIGNHCKKALWLYTTDYRKPADETEVRFFLTYDGKQMNDYAVASMIKRLSKKCGFGVHCHLFRHTFASRVAKKFPNAFVLSQILGHSSLEMSKQYIHLSQTDTQSMISPVDDILSK